MSHAIQIIYIHCTFFTRSVITKVDVDPKIYLSPFSHFILFYLLLLLLGPIWLFLGLFFFIFNPIFKPNFTQLALPKPIEIKKPLFIMQDDKGNVTLQFPKQEGLSSRIYTQGSRISSHP